MTGELFRYAALDARGARQRGRLYAASVEQAGALLRERRLAPLSITPARNREGPGTAPRPAQLAEFLQSIGLLLAAGATLTEALALARAGGAAGSVRRLSEAVEMQVVGGTRVSEAFERALDGRYRFLPALIAAAEAGGDLAETFAGAAEQVRSDARAADELWSALSYPLFVLAASVLAILILLLAVVPALGPLVSELSKAPPLPLRALIGLSELLRRWGDVLMLSGAVVIAVGMLAWALRLLEGLAEGALLGGPWRGITRGVTLGRFAALLGRLLGSGVAAPEAFQLAVSSVGPPRLRARLSQRSTRLYEGEPVSLVLAGCPGMPGLIVRMAGIGEQSGLLGEMLERAGRLEQAQALQRLQSLTRWIGPLMIVGLGGMIGLIMASLLSGVASLGDATF